MKETRMRLSKERTFACPDALGPCMIKFCVDSIATILEPITARSTTASFARFLDDTALGAPLAAYRGSACRRHECFCGHGDGKVTQQLLEVTVAMASLVTVDRIHA